MNTLEVRYSTLRNAFTLFGVLFYIQVIGFFPGWRIRQIWTWPKKTSKATRSIRFAV